MRIPYIFIWMTHPLRHFLVRKTLEVGHRKIRSPQPADKIMGGCLLAVLYGLVGFAILLILAAVLPYLIPIVLILILAWWISRRG